MLPTQRPVRMALFFSFLKTMLAAVSLDVERAAPSSNFSDEIDCITFITIRKAT